VEGEREMAGVALLADFQPWMKFTPGSFHVKPTNGLYLTDSDFFVFCILVVPCKKFVLPFIFIF